MFERIFRVIIWISRDKYSQILKEGISLWTLPPQNSLKNCIVLPTLSKRPSTHHVGDFYEMKSIKHFFTHSVDVWLNISDVKLLDVFINTCPAYFPIDILYCLVVLLRLFNCAEKYSRCTANYSWNTVHPLPLIPRHFIAHPFAENLFLSNARACFSVPPYMLYSCRGRY